MSQSLSPPSPKAMDVNVVVASPIASEALTALSQQYSVTSAVGASAIELANHLRSAEVVVCRSGVNLTADLLDSAPRLRLIVRAGSGTDNIDLDVVEERGITLRRIPEPGARAVAELAFALMLALARNLLVADANLRQGHSTKHELPGYLLHGKTLGIVGAGTIGAQVGAMGAAWGMRVIGCVKPGIAESELRSEEAEISLLGFDEVLKQSDFLSVHVPLNSETRGLIGRSELRAMKPGAFLLNLARGGVVDEKALLETLCADSGIAGAALDVHEQEYEGAVSPLAGLPNVILTPHIGAQTVDSQLDIGRRIEKIIREFFS